MAASSCSRASSSSTSRCNTFQSPRARAASMTSTHVKVCPPALNTRVPRCVGHARPITGNTSLVHVRPLSATSSASPQTNFSPTASWTAVCDHHRLVAPRVPPARPAGTRCWSNHRSPPRRTSSWRQARPALARRPSPFESASRLVRATAVPARARRHVGLRQGRSRSPTRWHSAVPAGPRPRTAHHPHSG